MTRKIFQSIMAVAGAVLIASLVIIVGVKVYFRIWEI